MMYRETDRQRPMSPQLALRVAIMGGIALVLFGIVFFRLWYLQILEGDRYRAEANDNQVREITVQAPRGEIVDREGRVLVDNRPGLAVKITPDRLPDDPAAKAQLYANLARLLDKDRRSLRRDVQRQLRILPFNTATVENDVKLPVVQYLQENQADFPGVTIERVYLRLYPHGDIGAHLFGYVSEVTEEQLGDERYRGVEQGQRVGQSGIEYSYDRFLRGENGARRLQVDALGQLRRQLNQREPRQGRQLRLSLDLETQEAGQRALGGSKGAFVVMDAKNGEIRALGSSPSFDPNIFSKQIKQSDFERLSDADNGAPLSNRAIQGLYPTGSTFKLVTSVAALEGGLITPDTPLAGGSAISVGGLRFQNAGNADYGSVSLRRALTVSSDVFFYRLGLDANESDLIQKWAGRLGLGHSTGVDLPAESRGLVPSPEWRNERFEKGQTERPWSAGDNINLSIGQGDLQANPLQMAIAYAAVANGGNVVTPHLGLRIEDAHGRPIQDLDTEPRRKLRISPEHRRAILEGLYGAANESGGTSTGVFRGFEVPVAGKTGTAQKGTGRADQSWYVALTDYPNVKYVVAVTFEAGGFGAETAAPAARRIISALYDIDDKGPPAAAAAGAYE
jgi:penicillin-binding protein 2